MNQFTESAVIKRRVLVVDDELINRSILGNILETQYLPYYAENGEEAYEMLRQSNYHFSLILLDLQMPVMDGFAFLELRKTDEALRRIPVIVMTADTAAEVTSIRHGAADFITKPFELPEVILARCERIIELSEDANFISDIKNDTVTGLYSKAFFHEFLTQHAPMIASELDAVAMNIDRFHMINELAGRHGGDRVLRLIAELINELMIPENGIACRVEADTFFVCCTHRDDYDDLLRRMQEELVKRSGTPHIRIRAGVYQRVDRSAITELWFDRAKIVCDRIRGDFTKRVEYYSEALRERHLFHERLINDIQQAIDEHHIIVLYQPKYSIQSEKPRLSSAEALVRWKHPELGMISPGEFIPLFESNGLILNLDNYVWNEAAAQVRRWKEQFGVTVPVSVNVSRVDIFDPELEKKLTGILEAHGLTPHEFLLEITETAYSDSGSTLGDVVERLRSLGFKIEMDDFGSGYSSLNMLNTLSIDVLKMDMKFIRNMLLDERCLRLVELILDIAKLLHVPAVAEGVEDEEQLRVLREMGCDYIQGYYFSKPVPPEEFETFIRAEMSA